MGDGISFREIDPVGYFPASRLRNREADGCQAFRIVTSFRPLPA